MIVYLNGEFVREDQAVVSIFDRSFRYGDGIFEALLARNGNIFRWDQHLERLERSAAFIKLSLNFSHDGLLRDAGQLLARNSLRDGVLRISVSRGTGPRGYAPSGTEKPVLVMTADPHLPTRPGRSAHIITSTFRIAAGDRLPQHKTSSRLLNVLAAMEARDAGAEEALLVDTAGNVTEGTSSNLFWIQGGTVCTAPAINGLLPGITRRAVLELCTALQIPVAEQAIAPAELTHMEGVFLTMTSRGVVEVGLVDNQTVAHSPITARLAEALNALITQECS